MSHSKHTKRGYSLYLEKRDPAAKKYIHTCADAGVIVLHWSWMNGAAVRIVPGFWEKENRAPVLPGIWRSCIVQGRFFYWISLATRRILWYNERSVYGRRIRRCHTNCAKPHTRKRRFVMNPDPYLWVQLKHLREH